MVTIWSQCLGLGGFRGLLGVLQDGGEQVRGLLAVARHGVRVPVERCAGVRMATVTDGFLMLEGGRWGGSHARLRVRRAACIIRGAVPRPIGRHRA